MNLESELDAFEKIATGKDTQTRLILVTGEGGMGKSHLLDLYKKVADANNLDVIFFGLGPLISVESCIDQIVSRLGCKKFLLYNDFLLKNTHEPSKETWQRNLIPNATKIV